MSDTFAKRFAKELLTQWLREEAEEAGYQEYTDSNLVSCWKVDRIDPDWGVYKDFPVTSLNYSKGVISSWDTVDRMKTIYFPGCYPNPTLHNLNEWKIDLICNIDVVIQQDGKIKTGIFIDTVPDDSLEFIKFISEFYDVEFPNIHLVSSNEIINRTEKYDEILPLLNVAEFY